MSVRGELNQGDHPWSSPGSSPGELSREYIQGARPGSSIGRSPGNLTREAYPVSSAGMITWCAHPGSLHGELTRGAHQGPSPGALPGSSHGELIGEANPGTNLGAGGSKGELTRDLTRGAHPRSSLEEFTRNSTRELTRSTHRVCSPIVLIRCPSSGCSTAEFTRDLTMGAKP